MQIELFKDKIFSCYVKDKASQGIQEGVYCYVTYTHIFSSVLKGPQMTQTQEEMLCVEQESF